MPVWAISAPKIALTSVLLPTPVLPKMARLKRPISSALSFHAFPKAWPNHSSVGFAMRQASQKCARVSPMTQLVRVHNMFVSNDGYAAGEGQSLEQPFGHANPLELGAWAFGTASWPGRADAGGTRGLEDYLVRDFHRNIGAEIMGRNKFGPQRGPWTDHEWQGWWGEEPPFHAPVFVMTHHERPSFTLSDTTFHFVNTDPATVLEMARQAAQGKDVRLGGGATTIRRFLDADLVDTLH